MNYIPTIGLEIHAELQTKTKAFCSCKNEFGLNANSNVCPICSGMPGTLPILGHQTVILAARASAVLDAKINNYSSFDRKNYFYPDLPKSYQITQFENPISNGGYIQIKTKKFRINHLHIEEDAGKLIHDNEQSVSNIDFNRCSVPLIEIVTEPDFTNADDVCAFVEELAQRLKYAEVCNAKMEQGSIRVDVNISMHPENSNILGTRAEIKNINSFKAIKNAIEYEINRQTKILSSGGSVTQETRRYDDSDRTTKSMRKKKESNDYRYFPEPDIPPIFLSDEEIEVICSNIPELPNKRKKRYKEIYNLTSEEANLISIDKDFSDFYDKTVSICKCYKKTASLMLVILRRLLNENKDNIENSKITPESLASLASLWEENKTSSNSAAEILKIMYASGKSPYEIAEKNGMLMSTDTTTAEKAVDKILSQNKKAAEDYKSGNKKAFGFLMGQAIAEAGKEANPAIIKKILTEKI